MVLRQNFQNPVYRTLEDTIDSNFTDLHHQRAPERDANLTRVTQLELVQNGWSTCPKPMETCSKSNVTRKYGGIFTRVRLAPRSGLR